MTFIPENDTNAVILQGLVYTYDKNELNPTRVWTFLQRELAHVHFYQYVMKGSGQYDEKYQRVRVVDRSEIREEIAEYLADAKTDYHFWRNEPDTHLKNQV
jgi:hypothetical protein